MSAEHSDEQIDRVLKAFASAAPPVTTSEARGL
jgi:hypothetical protein